MEDVVDQAFALLVGKAAPIQTPLVTPPTWTESPPKQFGVFTLAPPTNPGEIVRLRLPIGELVSRSVRELVRASQSRREAAARLEAQANLNAP